MIRRLFPGGFPAAEKAPEGSWRPALAAAFGLAAILIALYWPVVDFRLIDYDDHRYIAENGSLREGLTPETVVSAFTAPDPREYYLPLTYISFMADVEIFGMAARGFHLTNILLFAVDMAMLLLLLWRMTGALAISAFAAALVALHPLRVESVAWVSERKDVLSVFFMVLAIGCHLRYARTGNRRWQALLVACFLLGMLSKPMLVTLPILLLVLDFWPLGRFRQDPGEEGGAGTGRRIAALLLEKTPLLAISALLSIVAVRFMAGSSLHEDVPMLARLEHSLFSDLYYLYQTVWPADLVLRFFKASWDRFSGTLIPAAIALAATTAIVARSAGSRPWLAAGWAWYLVALFPVSGIAPSGTQWLSDRFTLIPHFGLAIALAWGAHDLFPVRRRCYLPALAVLLLVPLAILSRHQLYAWKDGATLFQRGLAQNADDPTYLDQYVSELMLAGDLGRAREQARRMLPLAMNPHIGVSIQSNYLTTLALLGERKEAIEQARGFLDRDDRFWRTRLLLADLLLAERRYAEAAAEFRTVLEIEGLRPADREWVQAGLDAAKNARERSGP